MSDRVVMILIDFQYGPFDGLFGPWSNHALGKFHLGGSGQEILILDSDRMSW